jgi:protein-S-isoprenylcysteine O-methyltransferase Ste14
MKGKLLVVLQFFIITLLVALGDIGVSALRYATVVTGILIGLWAIVSMRARVSVLPEPNNVDELITRGPYRYIRHPMYLAVLVTTGSFVINIATGLLWLLLFAVLLFKLGYEERLLLAKFKTYSKYCTETKRLIPFIF